MGFCPDSPNLGLSVALKKLQQPVLSPGVLKVEHRIEQPPKKKTNVTNV